MDWRPWRSPRPSSPGGWSSCTAGSATPPPWTPPPSAAGATPRSRRFDLAVAGGEDYELLAALPADAVEGAVTQLRERFGTSLTVVGEMRSTEGVVLVEADGSERSLETLGWDHFAQ